MKTYKKDRSGLDPARKPSDMEIMWAAGIYEGEGCCVRSGKSRSSFTVQVSQKDPELLYRLRDMFGGSIKQYNQAGGGLVGKNRRFMIYDWRLCGDKARIFLASIYPYLTARRKAQIDVTSAREFLDFIAELPEIKADTFAIHEQLTVCIDAYVNAHQQFAKAKRKDYMRQYDQQEEPKERRRLYMRELRKAKASAKIVKFG